MLCAALYKFSVALDASDTGTGKTYCALGVAREIEYTPAIVCPLTIIPAWQAVLKYFRMKAIFIVNWEHTKSRRFAFGRMTTEETYAWRLPPRTLLIFDEVHKAKGEFTQNSKILIAAKKQKIPILCLSATAATSPKEMRALGFVLGLHALVDFRQWAMRMGCVQDRWNALQVLDAKESMRHISEQIFPAKGSRMRIEDLGDAFPDVQVSADCYETRFADVQNHKYQELIEEIAELKRLHKKGWQAAAMTLNLRYRQFAELEKIDTLASLANDYHENGLSVAIFVNFDDTVTQLCGRLKCDAVSGSVTGAERQRAIDRFQANQSRTLVLNIQAGGVGISLHDLHGGYPRAGLVAPTYSAIGAKQVLGRLHRAGSKSPALYRFIYAQGTIEERVCRAMVKKIGAIDALNDADLMEPDIFELLET